ncbi:hypothetical protein REPUB_Repub06bG0025600 [Reevesia pubescens]
MDCATGCAANLCSEAAKGIFQEAKRHIRYVFIYKKNVEKFEKKRKTLIAKRRSVQLEVEAAERNLEEIKEDVKLWRETVDEKVEEGEKKVKDLEDKAKNKCFFSLCPNVKSRYQLSRKAEEGVTAFDELLQQGEFNSVSCPAPRPDIVDATPKDFEAFESRKKVFNLVMEALKKATINVIGVYGMGGMGKTTLVNEIARQVKKDKLFDEVVMAVVTQTPDILKIQVQLAELLGLKLEESSEAVRAARLRDRLNTEKKVLIILDDIWTKLDLNKVGIPFGDENKKCYILLTSRRQHVLKNEMDAQENFAVDVLEDEEAWVLFKKKAGDNFESDEMKSTAIEVAKKCAGLPLAIKTVASALKNKELFVWKDALRELPDAEVVHSAIMLSYNHLASEELKQTFLLCSLLRRNTSIEDLLRYAIGLGLMAGVNTVEGARNRLLTMVSQLKESCLLLDSYFRNKYLDMHDLVYDVAMSTASKDSRMFAPKDDDDLQNWLDGEEMKCCHKIYLQDLSICKLPDELNCPQLVLFLLFGEDLSLPTNFFKETTNLKVLGLTGMHISSLPSSIRLLTSLSTLCLDQCQLREVAIIGELKNLEILSLQNSRIKSLPKEIGRLFKLKLLDLSDCYELKIIPPGILSDLSRLEELYMGGTCIQWEVGGPTNQQSNASLAELLTLSRLTTLNVDILDANATPWDLFFEKLQKLEKYKIRIGMEGRMYWYRKYAYSRTLIFKLSTSIVHLNQGIKLKKTEYLDICELKGVKIALQMLKGEESFSHLRKLRIQNGSEIKYIINDNDVADEFPQLRSLRLEDLPQLISFCSEEKSGSTSKPQHELPLFNEKVSFPCLKKLHLSYINVYRIWRNQPSNGSFCTHPKLTSLTIKNCDNLKQLFSSFVARGLEHLKDLEITGCKLLREVIFMEDEDIEEENKATISFPQLNTLKIENCPELKEFIFNSATDTKKSFFSDKVSCPNLKTLEVWSCHNLKYMFPSSLIKHFKQLLELTLYRCENMEEVILVDGLAKAEGEGITTQMLFPKLEKLGLKSLPKLVRFCHEGDNSKSDALALFDEKVAFPCLNDLTIEGLGMWSKIWHHKVAMEAFEKLKALRILDCGSLEEIIELPEHELDPKLKGFNSKLHNLKWLSVTGCNEVKAKILGGEYLNFGETQPLFWVSDQETFSNLVPSFVSFQNLTYLTVSECHGFIKLVTLTVAKSMVQLDYMTIDDCQMMEEIVASSTSDEVMYGIVFSKLKTLKLEELPRLSSFFSGNCTFEFPSLEKLIINQCPKMEIFSKGELSTPKLQGIKSTEYGDNNVRNLEGDLNATVKQLFKEQDVQNSKEVKEDDDD